MSFNLTINFDKFEDLELFVNDINKYKTWKSKQEIKKKNQIKEPTEINDNLVEVLKNDDKRGLHQQEYYNKAKLYQNENPHLSYRDCLKTIYSNKKI